MTKHPEPDLLRRYAMVVLNGVGDANLGEWGEMDAAAYHVRRRLSVAEQRQVGPVIDVRGTPEALRRYARAQRYLPPGVPLV